MSGDPIYQSRALALMPGVLVFLGLFTHVLLLLAAGAVLALALWKESGRARSWTALGLLAGALAGFAVWHPLNI